MSSSGISVSPPQIRRLNALLDEFDTAGRKSNCAYRGYEGMLDEFKSVVAATQEASTRKSRRSLIFVEQMLEEYEFIIDKARQRQEATAEDFNLLEVLNLIDDESRHSMALAWLLDADVRHGTHAQGNLGFRIFLEGVHLPVFYANSVYRVRREVSGDESRIDICVQAPAEFLVYIENKIWSKEGKNQTDREWRDMQRRAAQTKTPRTAMHALFLTPEGRPPTNSQFTPVSYQQVADVVDRFAAEAKPADVKLFAKHYATALRKYIINEREQQEGKNEEDTK